MDFSRYGTPSREWLEFVARNPQAFQDGYNDNELQLASQLRESANKAREATSQRLLKQHNLDEKVDISTLSIPSRGSHSIPLRRYSPSSYSQDENGSKNPLTRCLVYFHGGGFLFGSETSDDYFCATMAHSLKIVVLSVIYRHTPDWPHPAQNQDAEDAMIYIEKNAANLGIDISTGLGVLGISAGAGLAAAMATRDRSHPQLISSVILSIPWLIHVENYPFEMFSSPDKSSKIQCRDAPVIPWPRLKMFSDLVDGGHTLSVSKDPLLNAALRPNEELRGWPKTTILVAGMDPLRDDGLLLATRLKALRSVILTKIQKNYRQNCILIKV